MKVMLYDDTPNHSEHFLKLVKQGYFDGTLFHRVIKNFMIQGGAQDSKMLLPALPSGPDEWIWKFYRNFVRVTFTKKELWQLHVEEMKRIPKKSDASQFYIVDGKTYTQGRLDTLEMAVNVPIKNTIIKQHYNPHKDELARLKTTDPSAFNALLDSVLQVVDAVLCPNSRQIKNCRRKTQGIFVVRWRTHARWRIYCFGEVVEGLDVIDKIADLETDERDRPKKTQKL